MASDKQNTIPEIDDRLHQFERNRYFYGKLMTASDFELDQRYHNSKRHLLNRVLYGEGIACGLHINLIDNREEGQWLVSLTPGVAFDCVGQEIIVSRNDGAYPVSTSRIDPNSSIEIQDEDTLIGVYIRRKDEEVDPVPSLFNSTQQDTCINSKIQENFEIFFDLLHNSELQTRNTGESKSDKEHSSDPNFSDECPSCHGHEPTVLLAVFAKNKSGKWLVDPARTKRSRKIIETQHTSKSKSYAGSDLIGHTTISSTTGITDEFEYKKGENMLFGHVKHYLDNISVPPVITLGKANGHDSVEFMEDYGLCTGDATTPDVCFKVVNIDLTSFTIRVDAKSKGKIRLRWWAIPSKETPKQKLTRITSPTIHFGLSQYHHLDDYATLTIVDPNTIKDVTQRNLVQVRIKTKTNPVEKKMNVLETESGGGIFTLRFPLKEITSTENDLVTATYDYKIGEKTGSLSTSTEIIQTIKPIIEFGKKRYGTKEDATIRIVGSTRNSSNPPIVEVRSKRYPENIKIIHTRPASDKTGLIPGTFIGEEDVYVGEITTNIGDTLIAEYRYEVGERTEIVHGTAQVVDESGADELSDHVVNIGYEIRDKIRDAGDEPHV